MKVYIYIYLLNGDVLKLVDKFTYLRSSVSSSENVNIRLAMALIAINRLSIIRKSNLCDKIKRDIFQAVVVSILLYGCTTCTLTKCIEKNLNWNSTRMLRVILDKSRSNNPQSSCCTAIYLPSLRPSKYDEQDMQDTTGEVITNS